MTTDSLANVKANFSTRDLASLEETIAVLSDPDMRRAAAEGQRDLAEGDVTEGWDTAQ